MMCADLNSTCEIATSAVRSSIAAHRRSSSTPMPSSDVHHDDLGAEARRERVVDVADRREVQRGHHDPVARRACTVWPERIVACASVTLGTITTSPLAGADQRRDFVAHATGHLPPALRPGAHTVRRPRVSVLSQSIRARPRGIAPSELETR